MKIKSFLKLDMYTFSNHQMQRDKVCGIGKLISRRRCESEKENFCVLQQFISLSFFFFLFL